MCFTDRLFICVSMGALLPRRSVNEPKMRFIDRIFDPMWGPVECPALFSFYFRVSFSPTPPYQQWRGLQGGWSEPSWAYGGHPQLFIGRRRGARGRGYGGRRPTVNSWTVRSNKFQVRSKPVCGCIDAEFCK